MKIQNNWKEILRRAWSVRFMALAIIFTSIEVALPFFSHEISHRLFAWLSIAAAVAALISRLIAQKNL